MSEESMQMNDPNIKKLSNHELNAVPSPGKKKMHAKKKKARKLANKMRRMNPHKK
jgi:hypothetical protein